MTDLIENSPPINYVPELEKRFGSEFFKLDPSDPRKKLLILVSRFHRNEALSPEYWWKTYESLNRVFDIKFAHADGFSEICENLNGVGKDLIGAVLGYHGNTNLIEGINQFDPIPPGCFEGLSKEMVFVLASCSTASPEVDLNFAEWWSGISLRPVIAPSKPAKSSYIEDVSTPESLSLKFPDIRVEQPWYFPFFGREKIVIEDLTRRIDPIEAKKKLTAHNLKQTAPSFSAQDAATGASVLGYFLIDPKNESTLRNLRIALVALHIENLAHSILVDPSPVKGFSSVLCAAKGVEDLGKVASEMGRSCRSSPSETVQKIGAGARAIGSAFQWAGKEGREAMVEYTASFLNFWAQNLSR